MSANRIVIITMAALQPQCRSLAGVLRRPPVAVIAAEGPQYEILAKKFRLTITQRDARLDLKDAHAFCEAFGGFAANSVLLCPSSALRVLGGERDTACFLVLEKAAVGGFTVKEVLF